MSKRRKGTVESEENKFKALMNSIHGNAFGKTKALPADPAAAAEAPAESAPRQLDPETIDVAAEVIVDPLALPAGVDDCAPISSPTEAAPPQILNPHIIAALVSNKLQARETASPIASADPEIPVAKQPGKPGRPRRLDKKPRPAPGGKRGRPATGKRSSTDWYGRTFYIRKCTDRVLEDALWQLKRTGIEIDKSELVDALLEHWAEVTLGDREDTAIGNLIENRHKP